MKVKSSVLLSVAFISRLAAGCVAGSENPRATERPKKGDAVGVAGERGRDLTVAEEIEIDRAEGELVETCMERQGHPYWPAPVANAEQRKVGVYVVDDVDWARRYGYGRPLEIAAEKARRSDPNATYYNALPKKERIRYSRALDGDFGHSISVELPSGGTVETSQKGCFAEARSGSTPTIRPGSGPRRP